MRAKEECRLCNILSNMDEVIHYVDDEIVICDTIYKRGHKYRFMVYTREHTRSPSNSVRGHAIGKLIEFGKNTIKGDMIVCGVQKTVPDHWHMIGCDMIGDDLEEMENWMVV